MGKTPTEEDINQMVDTVFLEELCGFIILCIIFALITIYYCCSNLGLAQNHKEVAKRNSLDAKSFQNCKQASKTISRAHQKGIKVAEVAPKKAHVTSKANKCLVGNSARDVKVPLKQIKFHETKVHIHAVLTSLDN